MYILLYTYLKVINETLNSTMVFSYLMHSRPTSKNGVPDLFTKEMSRRGVGKSDQRTTATIELCLGRKKIAKRLKELPLLLRCAVQARMPRVIYYISK